MERGEATRGRVDKEVAGAEAIEIKATIPEHQIEEAMARFGLTARNDEERFIYFFDTPKLDLLSAGIIARARRVVGDVHKPLIARRWKFEDPACPWPISAELWKRADGNRLMEVSIKAPVVQAAVAVAGFMAFLAEVGAERDKDQQSKTRWALDYYVAAFVIADRRGDHRPDRSRPVVGASARSPVL